MNIVSAGNTFQVYGEEVKTYKQLPTDTYEINFNKMMGFYLTKSYDLEINEKVYGDSERKVDKILNTFNQMNRNMGVILSGPKGVGKSMFARLLASKGYQENLPLLIVKDSYPDIANFISSIHQECIVLFDEFEKIFKEDRETGWNPQENLLNLFDGLDNGKKLFVITCNEIRGLSSYFLNRPGRFHYHFIMTPPTGNEVKEYMEDHLVGDARQYINKVVNLSTVSNFTYDILRAIAFELNNGYDISETMMDLNIERDRYLNLDAKIIFSNHLTAEAINIDLDIFNNRYMYETARFDTSLLPKEIQKYLSSFQIRLYTKDIFIDEYGYHINPEDVKIVWDDDWEYYEDENLKNKIQNFINDCKIVEVILSKSKSVYGTKEFTNKFLV